MEDKEGAKVLSVSGTSKIKKIQRVLPFIKVSILLKCLIGSLVKLRLLLKICEAFELDNCPLLIQAIIQKMRLM